MNSDMRSVGGVVPAPEVKRRTPATSDTRRIEERWAQQVIGPLFSPLQVPPLITSHISPQPETPPAVSLSAVGGGLLQIFVTGTLIRVGKPGTVVSGGGLRSIIIGFSYGSRRRFMRKMATIDRFQLPLFVTLTYPSEFSLDASDWKRDFDKWCKRLHRKFPAAGLVWRLEPQRRGAPHYHCLVYGLDGLDSELRQWMSVSWYECVNSGDPLHLKYGAYCKQTDGSKHVRSYVSKYMGKVQESPRNLDTSTGEIMSLVDWQKVGRWWGVRYGENLPWSEMVGGEILSSSEASGLMRFLRRYLHGQGVKARSGRGMSVFVDSPEQWLENLDSLIGFGGGGSGSFKQFNERIGVLYAN